MQQRTENEKPRISNFKKIQKQASKKRQNPCDNKLSDPTTNKKKFNSFLSSQKLKKTKLQQQGTENENHEFQISKNFKSKKRQNPCDDKLTDPTTNKKKF